MKYYHEDQGPVMNELLTKQNCSINYIVSNEILIIMKSTLFQMTYFEEKKFLIFFLKKTNFVFVSIVKFPVFVSQIPTFYNESKIFIHRNL